MARILQLPERKIVQRDGAIIQVIVSVDLESETVLDGVSVELRRIVDDSTTKGVEKTDIMMFDTGGEPASIPYGIIRKTPKCTQMIKMVDKEARLRLLFSIKRVKTAVRNRYVLRLTSEKGNFLCDTEPFQLTSRRTGVPASSPMLREEDAIRRAANEKAWEIDPFYGSYLNQPYLVTKYKNNERARSVREELLIKALNIEATKGKRHAKRRAEQPAVCKRCKVVTGATKDSLFEGLGVTKSCM